jgi:DamX protein
MVVRRLLECLEEEIFEASMMVVLDGAADASWMLKRFVRQLGVEDPAPEREGIIPQIYDQLAIIREDGRQPVLIIDDAHALAKRGSLAEVCSLLKLEYEDRRLLSLVLAGPAMLDHSLSADPSLAHRIDVRVELASFSPEAATGYLAHRVSEVGGDPGMIDGGALAALHELGRGYPGLMNTLADNALFEAFLCGRKQMTRVDVERAHRDLGWAAVARNASVPSPPESPAVAADPVLQQTLDELDPELAATFKTAQVAGGLPLPIAGPPKAEEAEPEDLLVELVED